MDGEILLGLLVGGFFVLGLPVIAIWALSRSFRLEREIVELRTLLRRVAERQPAASAAAPAAVSPPPVVEPQPETATQAAPPAEAAPSAVAAEPPIAASVSEAGPAPEAAPEPAAAAAPPPRPKETLEQKFGARFFAWIGALAVALAGVFLVKYSIDQGYLEPPARVALATLLGLVFTGAGEWLLKRDARIAQAVSAAGIAVLYAAVFAAVALYGLIGRGTGVGLAGLITAVAVALSLRQGPFVALLGLVGGTVAPVVLMESGGDALTLFAYLLALVAGVLVVVRHRRWWWLGWCALASAGLWAGAWIATADQLRDAIWVGLFLVGVGSLFAWAAWRSVREAPAAVELDGLVWAALGVTQTLLALLVDKAGYGVREWVLYAALAAVVFWQARSVARWQAMAIMPAALSLLIFAGWGQGIDSLQPGVPGAATMAWTAVVVAGAMSVAAYVLLWNARRPGFWAALASGSAFLHFAVVCGSLFDRGIGLSWGYVSLLLSLAPLLGAVRVERWRNRMPGAEEALGMLAVGATLFLSAAVPLELRREWITMAYAIELPAVAYIAWKLNLPILRWLAWLLTVTVTIRLVFNPYVLDYDVSSNPLLNWVLYGYGMPIVAYWYAARLLRRVAIDELVMAVEASILAFAFLLLTLEVRSIFHPGGLGETSFGSAERGWMAASWGALSLGLIYGAWRHPYRVLRWAWIASGAAAIVLTVFGQLVWLDDLFADRDIGGTRIFNGLLVSFGLPTLLAAGATMMLQRVGERWAALIAGMAALVFGFALLTYEIRHWFDFATGARAITPITDAELYAYSIVWLIFGAGLLVGGILRRDTMMRYASLAVLVLVVGKVFLVDMSDLTGLLRVASFLGLGVGLLALGFLYRRYVFRDDLQPGNPA